MQRRQDLTISSRHAHVDPDTRCEDRRRRPAVRSADRPQGQRLGLPLRL